MLSPVYGSLGKACLQPIMQREHQPRAHELTPDISDSLEFISLSAIIFPTFANAQGEWLSSVAIASSVWR